MRLWALEWVGWARPGTVCAAAVPHGPIALRPPALSSFFDPNKSPLPATQRGSTVSSFHGTQVARAAESLILPPGKSLEESLEENFTFLPCLERAASKRKHLGR